MFKDPINFIIRLMILVLGLIVASFGVATYLKARLGSDPVTVFLEGLHITFGITIGVATTIFMAFFLLILLIFDRSKLGIGTVVHTLGFGYLCDAWIYILNPIDISGTHFFIRLLVSFVATLALATGLGIYQAVYIGVGASEGFNQFAAKITKIPLRFTRMIFDATMLIFGLILGGVIHVATIHATFLLGPIMAGIFHKLTNFLISKNIISDEIVMEKLK